MKLLEAKVGLVTGAGSGLGRATALLAAEEGSKVIVADLNEQSGAETVDQIRRAGGDALFQRTDVSDEQQVEAMVARTVEEYGALHWASNNAVGGSAGFGPLHQIDERSWMSTLDVCLKGVFFGMKYEIPAMLESGGGSVVNITTAAVVMLTTDPPPLFSMAGISYFMPKNTPLRQTSIVLSQPRSSIS